MHRTTRTRQATRRWRRVADGLMANTCTIKRLRSGYQGAGRTTETWEVVATNVPCRVRNRSQQPQDNAGDQSGVTWTTWEIHVPHTYRLAKDDRIEVEGAQTFVVVGSETPEPTFRVETVVKVELVQMEARAFP